jgi:hypothetical protein
VENKEGEPLVGVFATNHQPQVLSPYCSQKKEPWSYHQINLTWLASTVKKERRKRTMTIADQRK